MSTEITEELADRMLLDADMNVVVKMFFCGPIGVLLGKYIKADPKNRIAFEIVTSEYGDGVWWSASSIVEMHLIDNYILALNAARNWCEKEAIFDGEWRFRESIFLK